jgi:hypothetical protein
MRAIHGSVLIVVAFLMPGCTGDASNSGLEDSGGVAKTDTGGLTDPYAPCTDQAKCCTAADMVCVGDPEKGTTSCKCGNLWDCSQNPKKCQQDIPTPGGGTWECTWTEQSYTCLGKPADSTPPGGNGWTCTQATSGTWTCTKASPPNPTNKPEGAGVWQCTVDKESNTLVCERDKPAPPPLPKTETNCADGIDNDGDGLVDCKDPDCPACPPPPCPTGTECCDGIDNDGDGKIDEGNVCGTWEQGTPCPVGAYQSCDCYCGVHRRCLADGTWGPCKVDQSCKTATITTHAQCASPQYCDFGKCVNYGYPLAKQCVHHNDCPNPMVCDLGQCITDHYVPCP